MQKDCNYQLGQQILCLENTDGALDVCFEDSVSVLLGTREDTKHNWCSCKENTELPKWRELEVQYASLDALEYSVMFQHYFQSFYIYCF